MNDVNRQVIEQFRANGGNVISGRFAGSRLLLLTTKGARTGLERVKPMMFYEDGGRYVVFASKAGAPTNPAWYHNLVAHPDVTVALGADSFPATATVTAAEERRRIWDAAAAEFPFLNDIQARTSRKLPVVVLARKT